MHTKFQSYLSYIFENIEFWQKVIYNLPSEEIPPHHRPLFLYKYNNVYYTIKALITSLYKYASYWVKHSYINTRRLNSDCFIRLYSDCVDIGRLSRWVPLKCPSTECMTNPRLSIIISLSELPREKPMPNPVPFPPPHTLLSLLDPQGEPLSPQGNIDLYWYKL